MEINLQLFEVFGIFWGKVKHVDPANFYVGINCKSALFCWLGWIPVTSYKLTKTAT